MTTVSNLKLAQGKTFKRVIRWEKEPFIYKPISAITKDAPARVTATAHGLPDGWRAAVVSVLGMRQINAANNPPKANEFRRVTVVDANTVEFNSVNACEYGTYASGGKLQFYTPADLTGCVARMTIRDVEGGAALIELTSSAAAGIDSVTGLAAALAASVASSSGTATAQADAENGAAGSTIVEATATAAGGATVLGAASGVQGAAGAAAALAAAQAIAARLYAALGVGDGASLANGISGATVGSVGAAQGQALAFGASGEIVALAHLNMVSALQLVNETYALTPITDLYATTLAAPSAVIGRDDETTHTGRYADLELFAEGA